MIKRADENDIPIIEAILSDAVDWMKKNNLENHWSSDNVKWDCLSKSYTISDFYLYYLGEQPAGCAAITERDNEYWENDEVGEALYIHKLAVKYIFRGKGITSAYMQFAKELARNTGHKSLKLDCNAERLKLRKTYENEGFILYKIVTRDDGSEMALYSLKVLPNN